MNKTSEKPAPRRGPGAKSNQARSSTSSSSSSCSPMQFDLDSGNKCGKCQNHEVDVSKKGHARDCPFKRCECLKCRLLDARSDILQVISGKETKLKGTKKDPNCGFCQNHGIKILRKGHVRSCGFGQERHFKLQDCFDCEVHYIRNEVNRLQIKMRRAMKEDRLLSEEQRKTAREPITRVEVEKVCDMARAARKKRETILGAQQVGETSAIQRQPQQHSSLRQMAAGVSGQQQGRRASAQAAKASQASRAAAMAQHHSPHQHHQLEPQHEQLQHRQGAAAMSLEPRQQQLQQHLGLCSLPLPLLKQEQTEHHQLHHHHHHHQQQQQQLQATNLANHHCRPSMEADEDVEVDVEDCDSQASTLWRPWSQQQQQQAADAARQQHTPHSNQSPGIQFIHQEAQQHPLSLTVELSPVQQQMQPHMSTTDIIDYGQRSQDLDLGETIPQDVGAQLQHQQLFNAIFRLFFTQFAQNAQASPTATNER